MSLDAKLREAAARGELNYLSLIAVTLHKTGKPTTTIFKATFSKASTCTNFTIEHADPATAVELALAQGAKRVRAAKAKAEADEDDGGWLG